MRSIFSVYLAANSSPDPRNTQLELPASPYRLLDALDELGIHDISEIDYWEVEQYHSFEYLMPHFSGDTSLADLNVLATKLASLTSEQSIAFEGLIKMEVEKRQPFGVERMIDLAYSTEGCHVLCDVYTDKQLGRFYADNDFLPELNGVPDNIYEKTGFRQDWP